MIPIASATLVKTGEIVDLGLFSTTTRRIVGSSRSEIAAAGSSTAVYGSAAHQSSPAEE